MAKWFAKTRSGKVYDSTSTNYIWRIPKEEEITSLDKVDGSLTARIAGNPLFFNYFVKSEAHLAFSPFSGGKPAEVTWSTVGCHIKTKEGILRLELSYTPDGKLVRLEAIPVKEATVDGL